MQAGPFRDSKAYLGRLTRGCQGIHLNNCCPHHWLACPINSFGFKHIKAMKTPWACPANSSSIRAQQGSIRAQQGSIRAQQGSIRAHAARQHQSTARQHQSTCSKAASEHSKAASEHSKAASEHMQQGSIRAQQGSIRAHQGSIRAHMVSTTCRHTHMPKQQRAQHCTQHPLQACLHAQTTAPASEHSNALGSAPQRRHHHTCPIKQLPYQTPHAGTLTCPNKHQSTNISSTLTCPNNSSSIRAHAAMYLEHINVLSIQCKQSHTQTIAPASEHSSTPCRPTHTPNQ